MIRGAARILLGLFLLGAGTAHLTVAREAFRAQVPSWFPADADAVVVVSGVVEIVLGLALVALVRHRALVGLVVAAFLVAIFPGNVAQFVEGRSAFGLDTDAARGVRLLFQPVLVAWALWCTGAWELLRRNGRARTRPRS
ncbi:DoxX family protein [Actinomycetospora flava]|uniref:DoxX family membrane protein n=1 Tax=Actinomycetospora flava TaxID=3129232 RepID=A0ABU8M233_9PSEU